MSMARTEPLLVLLLVAIVQAWQPTRRLLVSRLSEQSVMVSKTASKPTLERAWLGQRGGSNRAAASNSSSSRNAQRSSTGEIAFEVVGSGRIGSFLARAGQCKILGRDDSIDAQSEGSPILIATRNDALGGIVDKCPANRRKDLVFLQNGYLDDFLAERGLSANTQVLLYLSVTAKGADPVDGVTAVNPEGLTSATGVHAQAFAHHLTALNMKCRVLTPLQYRPAMFEKLMYVSMCIAVLLTTSSM
jgi:hypothetical protein